MNKSITLSKEDWETIIEGLSFANEEAEEMGDTERAENYMHLVNLISEELD